MRIYPYDLAPLQLTDVVFRPARLWLAFVVVFSMLLTGVFWVCIPPWPRYAFVGLGALVTLWGLHRTSRVCAPHSWLLRCNAGRLLININPLFSASAASAFVAELTRAEIEWLRAYRHTTVTDDAGESTATGATYLEIKPRGVDLEPLRSRIAAAATPSTWHGWTVFREVPVSLTTDGVVRLRWSGGNSLTTPSLKRALKLLGQEFPVLAPVSEHNDLMVPAADKQKMG